MRQQHIDLVESGELFEMEKFRETPPDLRRLNDIAFSGDGEPTTCPQFDAIVEAVAEVKERRGLDAVKLVLITNATQFHKPAVQHGTYSFYFWDADDNAWEILANPEGGYSWMFERGDQEGLGHLSRRFDRPESTRRKTAKD
jgi:hypothetical protein